MSIKIGICDDKIEDIGRLSEALYNYDSSFQITSYSDGESLLEDCLESKIIFDLIFLDIYMPGINGIEIAGRIRTAFRDTKIVFVSVSNEHYPDAYNVFAFNYLLKPINKQKLTNILDQVLMSITDERRRQINFSYKGTNYRVFCKDILYIESRDKIILFHLLDKTTLQCYSKLDEILALVPEDGFIRCHQSFAVNNYHIKEMTERHFLVGNTLINISKKYRKESKDQYFGYLFTHMNHRGN